MVLQCLADSNKFSEWSLLCYCSLEGPELLIALMFAPAGKAVGFRPEGLCCHPEMAHSHSGQPSSHPCAHGVVEWGEMQKGQEGKRERWVGVPGPRSEEEEKGDTASFGVSQYDKNTQKGRGRGGPRGEVEVEQWLWFSSQIHGKSSFHTLWFS